MTGWPCLKHTGSITGATLFPHTLRQTAAQHISWPTNSTQRSA